MARPVPIKPAASYMVPFDKRAQLIYLRAGNSTPELVYLALSRNSKPFRFFPIGAKGAIHVQLAIVEDLEPESEIELSIGAPEALEGLVMIDLGLMEV